MNNEINDTVMGDNGEIAPKKKREFRAGHAVVLANYCLPFLSVLTLLVMGFFRNVRFVFRDPISLWKLLFNSLKTSREYLGTGTHVEVKNYFFGILAAISVLEVLLFLLALFFTGLAAYTALRAFFAEHDDARVKKAKIAFKIAFPNRVCLWLSTLFLLLPAAYPHIFSLVSAQFLLVTTSDAVYVSSNPVFLVAAILAALCTLLALISPCLERKLKMSMFHSYHAE